MKLLVFCGGLIVLFVVLAVMADKGASPREYDAEAIASAGPPPDPATQKAAKAAENARLRREAVEKTEHTMLMNGMEVKVSEVGDAMHFEYVGCGRSFLTQLQSVAKPLKKFGFKRLTCVDASNERFELGL